jgi:hypothetical protein
MIKAPTFFLESRPAAVMTSSIVSAARSARLKYRKNGALPRCESARRMSDWNSTIAAITTYASVLRISHDTVWSGNICET